MSLAPIPSAFAMSNRNLGGGPFGFQAGIGDGAGLNNIGLLVRTWGRIVERDASSPATWFRIDDGSGVNVKCVVSGGVSIDPNWIYVGVTGISSCEKPGDDLLRLIRVRDAADIRAYLSAQ